MTPYCGGQVAVRGEGDDRPPRGVHAGVADLGARAVGVDDGVLEVLHDRATIAREGVALLVPIALWPILRHDWNKLNSKEKVWMLPKIIGIAITEKFRAESSGAGAVEESMMKVVAMVPAEGAPMHVIIADMI